MSKTVVINQSGINSIVTVKDKSRFSMYFDQNTNATPLVLNTWAKFADVSGGIVTVMNTNNDFTIDSTLRMTYNGADSKWFNLTAVTNIMKATGGNTTRTIELQWRLNGVGVGIIRQSQSNDEANIYTGIGDLYLSSGDYIEPWCKNVENGDSIKLDNASFIVEEIVLSYLSI